MARIQPRLLKGFRDYLPQVMVPRVKLLRRISEIFERFGFEPLDTPSIEYADILLGKAGPDAEKLFYRFQDAGDRDVALRYELTISLARVIAQYKTDLPRPFKRYQMGPVWRAEAPAKGRFREFWQCDVDIVGSDSLLCDAECLAIDNAVMTALGVPNYVIRFNNRKLFRALQIKLGVTESAVMDEVMRGVDKFDKIGADGVREVIEKQVGQGGFTTDGVDTVMEFLKLAQAETDNDGRMVLLEEFLAGSEIAKVGVNELRTVLSSARTLGVDDSVLQIDPTIVRGLDYYTGTVFETFLKDLPAFGSVMSGGRYDGLVGLFTGQDEPAVGISVGIDRLIAALEELDLLPATRASATALVTVFGDETLEYSLKVTRKLRDSGVNTELYLNKGKLAKQMKYASRKGIPLVIIAGTEEEKQGIVTLREMETGNQTSVEFDLVTQAVQDAWADPDPNPRSGKSWDWEFSETVIDRVPEVGGVYVLRGQGQEVLTCGWASYGQLRSAIKNSVTDEQRVQVTTFDWYEIRDDQLSETLCQFLIEKLNPPFHM
ncbi:histidine--tRNA ligase [Planctomycetota bacterium]|nr:histidine--tRNA ligase [Planctomycetota bacterium]